MSRALRLIGCLTAIMCLSVASNAATLDLLLNTYGPLNSVGAEANTWTLTAMTSSGDNDGIAGYNIAVLNSDSTDHVIQAQGFPGPFFVKGFTLSDATNDVLFAGQNSTQVSSLLYGIGSPDFTVPEAGAGQSNYGMPPVGESFAPVVLATGTGAWDLVDIGSASANVWSLGASPERGMTTDAESADVLITVVRDNVPEPASFALFGLAVAGILAARRR